MEWIKTKDRLPEDDSSVLIAYNEYLGGEFYIELVEYNSEYFNQKGFWINENGGEYQTKYNPTYWMPLPKPPTE